MLDRYTKTVLTVIAGALVMLATQNAVQPSRAQPSGVQKVAICDEGGRACVNVVLGGLLMRDARNP